MQSKPIDYSIHVKATWKTFVLAHGTLILPLAARDSIIVGNFPGPQFDPVGVHKELPGTLSEKVIFVLPGRFVMQNDPVPLGPHVVAGTDVVVDTVWFEFGST